MNSFDQLGGVIINQNYRQYNNKICLQKEGFVLGGSLRVLLSEIYNMQHYETTNITNIFSIF